MGLYGQTLQARVRGDTSGDYQVRLLLPLDLFTMLGRTESKGSEDVCRTKLTFLSSLPFFFQKLLVAVVGQ